MLTHKEGSLFDDGEESDEHKMVSKESADGLKMYSSPNCNEKFRRKRKSQNDEDDDNSEENMQGNDDPTTQKKQRVVWNFVAAVNQLGIDSIFMYRPFFLFYLTFIFLCTKPLLRFF